MVLLMVLSPLVNIFNSKWEKHLISKQLELDKIIILKQKELASLKIENDREISMMEAANASVSNRPSFNIDLPLPVDVPPLSFIEKKKSYDINKNGSYSEVPKNTEELIKKHVILTPKTTSEKKILNNTSISNSLSKNTVPFSTLELAKKHVEERMRKEKESDISKSNDKFTNNKKVNNDGRDLPKVSAAVKAYNEPSDRDLARAKSVTDDLFNSNKTPVAPVEGTKKVSDSSLANIMSSGHLVSATQKYQVQESTKNGNVSTSISSKMDELLESINERPKTATFESATINNLNFAKNNANEESRGVVNSNNGYQNKGSKSFMDNLSMSNHQEEGEENTETSLKDSNILVSNKLSDFSNQIPFENIDSKSNTLETSSVPRYKAATPPTEEEKEAMKATKTAISSDLGGNGNSNYIGKQLDSNQVAVGNYHSTAKPIGEGKLVDEDEDIVEELPDGIDDLESAIAGLSGSRVVESARSQYRFPPINLVKEYPETSNDVDPFTLEKQEKLVQTLAEFKYVVKPRRIIKGPTVTMFEIVPEPGIRVNSISNLSDNIAMNLMAQKVRILAPIPGEAAVGVEIPNEHRDIVGFRDILTKTECDKMAIPMTMGRDLYGNCKVFDVTTGPHMLIAGSTGSGKSVCINSLICSILYTKTPKEVRLIMVDPKVVELTVYNGIPHLLTPVITETKRALKALDFCIDEMERRNKMLAKMSVRNIKSYNQKLKESKIAVERMPYIVVIIDEFASLMSTAGKDLDEKVSRLTAMSRAVGIHLVFATQRPSVDVITGVIKNNLPTRVAFAVTSSQDSRTIIGATGAENLLGKGDLLFSENGRAVTRLQGVFLSDDEVSNIVAFAKNQGPTDYIDESYFESYDDDGSDDSVETSSTDDSDSLWDSAIRILLERKSISASFLQRRLRIGYNRAARLVEEMEEQGIVGPPNGSKPRELLKYPDMVENN
ncbi:MAG: DNA translocase FtsK [Spirochaetaceae bacterium]|nr:DNA translocase FtsK [Spirochaetaceae bacterium]